MAQRYAILELDVCPSVTGSRAQRRAVDQGILRLRRHPSLFRFHCLGPDHHVEV